MNKKNIPNILTIFRIVLVPLFTFAVLRGGPAWTAAALAAFIIASVTDFFDGFLARRWKLVSDFGKFFDPLADKILVTAALVTFVERGFISAWYVVIILFREFAVSGIRMLAATGNGTVMAAALPGKLKTASTMVSIIIIMAVDILSSGGMAGTTAVFIINNTLMLVCTALTIWSGADYASAFLKRNKEQKT